MKGRLIKRRHKISRLLPKECLNHQRDHPANLNIKEGEKSVTFLRPKLKKQILTKTSTQNPHHTPSTTLMSPVITLTLDLSSPTPKTQPFLPKQPSWCLSSNTCQTVTIIPPASKFPNPPTTNFKSRTKAIWPSRCQLTTPKLVGSANYERRSERSTFPTKTHNIFDSFSLSYSDWLLFILRFTCRIYADFIKFYRGE